VVKALQNQLIALLPRAQQQRFLALCEPVQLVLSEVLCQPGELMRHAYFPVDHSFISLVAWVDGQSALEVGMVGHEGMLGVPLALGVLKAPLQALAQGPGPAWRIARAPLRRALAASPHLQRILQRYVVVLMDQLATSAACARFHTVGPRLARWLLMTQDRAQADHFAVTHEFLAYMLGMRRVGITQAAKALQTQGLIEYHRGHLKVRNRPGLQAMACACYARDQAAYAQIMA
jgi:CRP-like cAMP-binding protein